MLTCLCAWCVKAGREREGQKSLGTPQWGVMEGLLDAIKAGDEGEVTRLLDADPALLEGADDEGHRPLTVAAEYWRLGLLKLLLERGNDVNTTDGHGKTALHWAAQKGHEEVVVFLLSKGAQANSITHRNTTSLMLACGGGRLSVARLLLQHVGGQAVRETNEQGLTPLHYAASEGHEEIASLLLGQGAQANSRTSAGKTPLVTACSKGHVGMVRLLLQHMGNQALQETNNQGWTALYWAVNGGHEETVSLLLGQGAQANSRTSGGKTPLVKACSKGHTGVVRVLLQHVGGEALQETDGKGWTALHWAVNGGHEETVSLLLGQGAQANSRTIKGTTPLVMACSKGHVGVVRVLLQHVGGEALQETNDKGWTALHLAAQGGHEEVVSLLLGQGAQANSRTIKGTTPLVMACSKGHVGRVRVLLQHVGNQALQETNDKGWTALHLAAQGGHEEMVSFLLGQANSRTILGRTPFVLACKKGRVGVVRSLLKHVGTQALKESDGQGMTALHWAAQNEFGEVVRLLLVANADPTIVNADGMTPRILAEDYGHTGCLAVFEWYECELERRAVLYRATCLHKTHTTQRDMPTSQVPAYLQARVAAGRAVPRVVVLPQAERRATRSITLQAEASGKRKAAGESGDAQGAAAGGEAERHAMLEYVVTALNEELVTELLGGFPYEK